jgi:hypothetical protein
MVPRQKGNVGNADQRILFMKRVVLFAKIAVPQNVGKTAAPNL